MSDDKIGTGALDVSDAEAAAVAKGERVTIDNLRDEIDSVYFVNALDAVTMQQVTEGACRALVCSTICLLVLRNGFTIVGKSACAHPDNFNQELGEKLARDDAERQAWAFLGFRLRDKLAAQ